MIIVTEIKMNISSKSGGRRKGAGRPRAVEQTKIIRVPESSVEHIKAWVEQRKLNFDLHNVMDFLPVVITTDRHQIPLMLERVAAGFPSPAADYVEETVDLNEHLIQNKNATYIVRVASQSMLNAGIDTGDALVVDKSLNAQNNDIVIATINGQFTCKRYMVEVSGKTRRVWLQAENPDFASIYPKEGDVLIINGVVTSVIKQFHRGRAK